MRADHEWIGKVSSFATEIGLRVRFGRKCWRNEILPGTRIWHGGLSVDPRRILDYGDVFHEMGHLAILPGEIRRFATGDVDASTRKHAERVFALHLNPDEAIIRALIQSGETEAQAWAYAAQVQCGLQPTMRLVAVSLEGVREVPQDEIEIDLWALSKGHHLGVHGLAAAGMTKVREFPKMLRWVQP